MFKIFKVFKQRRIDNDDNPSGLDIRGHGHLQNLEMRDRPSPLSTTQHVGMRVCTNLLNCANQTVWVTDDVTCAC